MHHLNRLFVTLILLLSAAPLSAQSLQTHNVILVTTDGVRWQDVFSGADPLLLDKPKGGVADVDAIKKQFWRDTPESRREAFMPFLWNTVAKQGQLYGNATKGSVAVIANDKKFSYPGYNEILVGYPDPNIKSNDPIPNPNVTVLEWLHRKDDFAGKVAAFSEWDALAAIINRDRAGFPVMAGQEPLPEKNPTPRQELLNELMADLVNDFPSRTETFDALVLHAALEHLRAHQPRVLYVSFGQTDTVAHAGRYDNVLRLGHQVDSYIARLWSAAQSLPQYKDRTTLIVTTDHGRGSGPVEWKNHSADTAGAENIWIAILGPDTPALGERANIGQVTQSQVAATLAALLGQDYHSAVPRSGPPITDALPPNSAPKR